MKEATRLAKSYYNLLEERRSLERDILLGSPSRPAGTPRNPTPGDSTGDLAIRLIERKEELNKRIQALQMALEGMRDDTERQLIRKNLFQRIPLHWINLPMSESTMKLIRKRYLRAVLRCLVSGNKQA